MKPANSRRHPLFLLLATLLALVALSGCGDDADDEAQAVATTEAPADDDAAEDDAEDAEDDATTTTTTTTVAPSFPRQVEDALGTVDIETAPARVVVLDQSLLDAALTLELEVIGYTTYADPEGPIPELYQDVAATYAPEATWVGDLLAPNLEAIAALQPDMILTSIVRHEAIAEQLQAIAPTVMTVSGGAGWKDTLDLVSRATGREDIAAQALAAYLERATEVGDAISDEHGDPTVSVVRFVDEIRLYQPTSFSGVVLADVGLSRPESQQLPDDFIQVISQEELPLADADVLVYSAFDHPDVEAALDEILGGPLWATLDVVQRGEVYPVEDARWMSGVGLFGAHAILDDLTEIFGVNGAAS